MDKDFEKLGEMKIRSNNNAPLIEMKYNGKKLYEYDMYNWDDFILKIRKHHDFDGPQLYEVIYEDAYGEWNGELLTKEEIKNKYNIITE